LATYVNQKVIQHLLQPMLWNISKIKLKKI